MKLVMSATKEVKIVVDFRSKLLKIDKRSFK